MPDNFDELLKELQKYELAITEAGSHHSLVTTLSQHIEYLIIHDFDRLIQLLYRLDVNEDKIRKVLEVGSDKPSVSIAKLIIERQEQKIRLRKSFKADTDIPDDEEW
jgi:hypothetical protein